MKKSIVALGIVLALSGCAAAADETLAAEPAALVEISPATEETAQPVEAAATAEEKLYATLIDVCYENMSYDRQVDFWRHVLETNSLVCEVKE